MQETSQISFDITTSDSSAAISVFVFLDKDCLYSTQHLTNSETLRFSLADDDAEHELTIEIAGKTAEHTKIDEQGLIVKDVVIEISNFTVDGIDVNQLFQEKTVYQHNFNGTKDSVQDEFFGTAGCNGTLSFKFTTPMYLWLLENM